ncbi:hypothetical protein BUALT_Bualt06G0094700 [Buddleja alternifolia]|uniref:Uncharacterized protein n=1 Tax=Buddleja alternifolia TaxID=168488 RepID=A0AAV6XLM6_9LAMI|nr:hypothetical protein BUALT_Bualt06G0094700 [Buddleja alternifolia]
MTIDMDIDLEDNGGVKLKKEYESCSRCLELQHKITIADGKWALLELDIGKKISEIELLEGKLGSMEREKLEIECEVRVLKQSNEELEKIVRNGGDDDDDDDKVTQLMIENKVLECEKSKAESEVKVWKAKCKDLEMQVIDLEKRLSTGMMKTSSNLPARPSIVQIDIENNANEDKAMSGTPPINTPFKQYIDAGVEKGGHKLESNSRVRKFLDFGGERGSKKNISPSTPGGRPPFGPIDISDSDDDPNTAHLHSLDLDRKGGDEEETTLYSGKRAYLSTSRTKRVRRGVANIVKSESESDDDDNIPICRLGSKNLLEHNTDTNLNRNSVNDSCSKDNLNEHTPRRRLVRVGNRKDKGVLGKYSYKRTGSKKDFGIPQTANENVDEDEIEEVDSGSEGESLGGFIVSDSDVSESGSASNCDDISEVDGTGVCSGDSENSMAYDEIMSSLRRERKDKMEWEYEADMLADFGRCPELCMKAVCALYRQQTSEEQSCKATLNLNGRGFSQIHALRKEITLEVEQPSDEEKTSCYDGRRQNRSTPRTNPVRRDDVLGKCSYAKAMNDKIKWKNVWDMDADFDRFPRLCMKAVCALYRLQTPEERRCKETIDCNGRGLNWDHVHRGIEFAEFLTGGDPNSGVKKSVKEFKVFDPNGVELCRTYATYYRYQLFRIYENEEDPFFP